MFSKTDPSDAPRTQFGKARSSKPSGTPSVIGQGMRITGEIKCEGVVQIDGIVAGDITATGVTVGKDASITGEIRADEVTVHGTLEGRITARLATLSATARVTGDVYHEVISVEAGAQIEGRCKHQAKAPTIS